MSSEQYESSNTILYTPTPYSHLRSWKAIFIGFIKMLRPADFSIHSYEVLCFMHPAAAPQGALAKNADHTA